MQDAITDETCEVSDEEVNPKQTWEILRQAFKYSRMSVLAHFWKDKDLFS